MQFCDINKLPSQIADGTMTIDEGAAMIQSVVRGNPRAFGLGGLNNDIIEAVFNRLDTFCCQNILKIFDSAGGTLQNQLSLYIHYLVRHLKWLWRKEHRLSNAYERVTDSDDDDEVTEHMARGTRRILQQRAKRRIRTRQSHQQ